MKIVSTREVYKCGLFRVTEEEATDPSGFDIKTLHRAAHGLRRHDGG